ncbi:Beta-hexosaminidase [Exophiala dermatitidis]
MHPYFFLAPFCIPVVSAIWPQPARISTGDKVLWLDPAIKATLRCDGEEFVVYDHYHGLGDTSLLGLANYAFQSAQTLFAQFHAVDKDTSSEETKHTLTEALIAQNAVQETLRSMRDTRFVPWKLHSRHSTFEPDATAPRHYLSSLQIQQRHCPSTRGFESKPYFTGDESYQIIIDNGTATIRSNDTIGTLWGLQTLKQLFYAHSSRSGSYMANAPFSVIDGPRWRYRGLSVDIARNPIQPEDLRRTIDAMARTKMNRLHIHATDSQSWPLEIPSLPDLARKGAYQPHLVWTTSSLEGIQLYGVSKGVSVFVEIDMPGHTASVAHAYPELVAAYNQLDWSTFAAEPLSGQLKLNSSKVSAFVTDLLNDILPRTSRYTSLYHIGGDEVNRAAYLLDETVNSDDPEVLQPLLQSFIDTVVGLAVQHGLQPVVWEEMLSDWNLTLPSATVDGSVDTLIQVWRNSERIEEVLKKGHRAIFGDYHHWYLDCGFGGFLNPYPSGKSPHGVPYNTSGGYPTRLKKPYLDYCSPFHNWRQIYTYNPLENITADLLGNIEGGEVLMWSEQTDSVDLDFKLWPRVAAAAEVLWTGVRNETMLEAASRRLGEWREREVTDFDMGMTPVQMTWCLMEGGCNL